MSYSLSIEQVNAILELRLQKLTAFGIGEIESEINKLAKLIIEYNKIINSKKELYKLISEELEKIKDKFSSPRKTISSSPEIILFFRDKYWPIFIPISG